MHLTVQIDFLWLIILLTTATMLAWFCDLFSSLSLRLTIFGLERLTEEERLDTNWVGTLRSSPISLCVLVFVAVIFTIYKRVVALTYFMQSRLRLELPLLCSWPCSILIGICSFTIGVTFRFNSVYASSSLSAPLGIGSLLSSVWELAFSLNSRRSLVAIAAYDISSSLESLCLSIVKDSLFPFHSAGSKRTSP